MKFGVYYTFRNRDEPASAAFYDAVLEQVELVEALGYDYVLLTEHHFLSDGYMPSMMPMLAAFAMRTSSIGIGTNVLLLPLHHPIRVAEDAAVVDLLSGGRFVLGIAAGYRPQELAAFGVDPADRGRLMEEGVTTIRRAWSEPDPQNDREVYPKPAHAVPIWMGGFSRPAIARAVRLGDAYMIGGKAVVSDGPYQTYREELERQGKTPDEVPLIGNRVVHVAESDARAWAEAGEALLYQHNSYASWFAAASDKRGLGMASSVSELPADDYIVGSPETCRQRIASYQQELNVEAMTFNAHIVGTSLETARRSLDLFAKEVMPQFAEVERV
jgi:alkanesulfonate monooxygenase SsuD/methylene tetrahydromethanopterin reductase-like flavin-dependent oxidoreductase (luciferase family)